MRAMYGSNKLSSQAISYPMQIGDFAIEQLSEGFFELFEDGTFQKMDPDRIRHAADDPSLGRYSSALGIDPLLITNGETNIVVDPGLGWGLDYNSRYRDTSNVVTNLNIFGLRPEDIHHVVLSHLHYDHAAGCTFVDQHIKTCAVFPYAKYHLHRLEWEHALTESEQGTNVKGAGYRLDELYRLAAEERFTFMDNDIFELIPGITLMKTGGHTPGHLVVKIESGGKAGYYMCDLIPTEYHLDRKSVV
mgnify:CR=1 FL=1